MKYTPLFLLIFSHTFGMQSPQQPANQLTKIPFEGDSVQLISFAEAMALGQLKIGNSGSSESKKEIEFVFSDFRNPEVTYKATRAQAWDATRYIAAIGIHNVIYQQENTVFIDAFCPDQEMVERYKNRVAMQKAGYKLQLTALNVSHTIAKETMPQWDITFQEINFNDKDSEEKKASKMEKLLTALQELKHALAFLQHVAFIRFYRFWSGQDLVTQTQNDHLRDFGQVKKNREIFFKALEMNDVYTLDDYSKKLNTLLSKKKLPVGQMIEKMINHLSVPKPWEQRSPQNSDDEVW